MKTVPSGVKTWQNSSKTSHGFVLNWCDNLPASRSQRNVFPSRSADANQRLSREKTRPSHIFCMLGKRWMILPSSTRCTPSSPLPSRPAIRLASGETVARKMPSSWRLLRNASDWPVRTSHTPTSNHIVADEMRVPSGENARDDTPAACRNRVVPMRTTAYGGSGSPWASVSWAYAKEEKANAASDTTSVAQSTNRFIGFSHSKAIVTSRNPYNKHLWPTASPGSSLRA